MIANLIPACQRRTPLPRSSSSALIDFARLSYSTGSPTMLCALSALLELYCTHNPRRRPATAMLHPLDIRLVTCSDSHAPSFRHETSHVRRAPTPWHPLSQGKFKLWRRRRRRQEMHGGEGRWVGRSCDISAASTRVRVARAVCLCEQPHATRKIFVSQHMHQHRLLKTPRRRWAPRHRSPHACACACARHQLVLQARVWKTNTVRSHDIEEGRWPRQKMARVFDA